jgi:murein L,D-transpeptidase YcbB/YkuD
MTPNRRHLGSLPSLIAVLLMALPALVLADEALRERLAQVDGSGGSAVSGVALGSAPLLRELYRLRDYRYAWNNAGQVDAFRRIAERSHEDGLDPDDFHVREIEALVGHRSPPELPSQSRIDAELLLSDGLLRLIRYTRHGKVDPKALDRKWNHGEGPRPQRLVQDLERALDGRDLGREWRHMMHRPTFYTRLQKGLEQYRDIAAAGGWPQVPPGRLLKPGMRDERVPALRQRLRVTGEYRGGEPAEPRRYDDALRAAVLAFQERHTLGVDGIVGRATLAAMNISAQRRVEQIRVNLERMRWVADEMPGDFLLVDIAAQKLRLFRQGRPVWSSRVIVGRAERPTPVFRDRIEYLEFNPTWTVPPTILAEDILPKARKDPGAVRKKGLTVIGRDGRAVDPETVDWSLSANNLPYKLRQPPGDANALGQVKFMFPNRYAVYLHDTPDRRLFERPKRTFSSGCVRVERPFELAELLLDDPGWNQERFATLIAARQPHTVRLKDPIAVILSYWTAEAGEDGEIRFREDIYDRDDQVLAALNGSGRLFAASAPAASSKPVAAPRPKAPTAEDGPRTGAYRATRSSEAPLPVDPSGPASSATSKRGILGRVFAAGRGETKVAEAVPQSRDQKRNRGTDLPGEGPLFNF